MKNVLVIFPINFSRYNTILFYYFGIKEFIRIHFISVFDLWTITIEYLKEMIWSVFISFIYDIINNFLQKCGWVGSNTFLSILVM